MPAPQYDARTVTAPDGTRITVAYQHGSRIGTMTDAEFLNEVHPDLIRSTKTANPTKPDDADNLPDNVLDLAEERLRRHHPGTPYTADELTPLLTGPNPREHAEQIATLLNSVIDRIRNEHRP
ncbi:hypothetical protein ACH4GZ_38675 [Streptomyces hygroscopicus]|uniref:hypothetical protein n=1 Tax=Streptomyces hygroscopicus TaxID=1912 RepID=UPI0037A53529